MANVGRPPREFKEEYCNLLINHMEQGFSFEAFAGVIRCGTDTLYKWLDQYPEFLDARSIGNGLSRLYWEKEGKQGLWYSKENMFNSVVWLANMRNRFGWDAKVKSNQDRAPVTFTISVENNE